MMNDLHGKTGCPFNLAHKPIRTKNVPNGNEMRETEMDVLLCGTQKNPETVQTDSYERDRSLR